MKYMTLFLVTVIAFVSFVNASQAAEPPPTPAPTPDPQSPAVIDGKAAGVLLGKKAFDRGDLNTGWVEPVMNPPDWSALEKKYGESGAEDYVEARSEAAEQEFNRLVVNAIGEKPDDKGAYDKSDATRVYWNVLGMISQALKRMAHDERSIQLRHDIGSYSLTRYKNKYAWGLTVGYTGKNAFNATVKNSVNVYVANNSVIDIEEDGKSIADKNLGIALAKSAAAKAAAPKKGAVKKKKE